MGQTVNLLAYAFGGSNPSPPTKKRMLKSIRFFVSVFFYLSFAEASLMRRMASRILSSEVA